MRYLLLLITLLIWLAGHSQYVYVSAGANEIYRFDLSSGCSAGLFAQCGSPDGEIQDIAVDAFGKLYICRNDSVFLLDTNNPGAGCNFITTLGNHTTNSIEVGPDGKLYFADQHLVRYSFTNNTFEDLGPLPSSMVSGGDLVFYVNRLYMTSASGSIYEIDVNSPSRSQLYYNPGIPNFKGFVISPARCFDAVSDELRLFAFEDLGNKQTAVHILDMENKLTYTNFCVTGIAVNGNTGFHPPPVITGSIDNITVTVKAPACSTTNDGSISIVLPASANDNYSFTMNSLLENNTGVFNNLGIGEHELSIRNKLGCSIDTIVTLVPRIQDCADSFYMPNAFTPNSDGRNDIFRAKSFIPYQQFHMRVFDRNGQCVFSSNSMSNGWDGTVNGKLQDTNVYIWLINYTDLSGRPVHRKGHVTLIR